VALFVPVPLDGQHALALHRFTPIRLVRLLKVGSSFTRDTKAGEDGSNIMGLTRPRLSGRPDGYTFLMPLLQQLKRVREERGMSPRELSARSGVSADSISDFEELRRMASQRTARRLAEALGVRAEDLQ
jgi:DNA-binding XRE family transcriptional regulator